MTTHGSGGETGAQPWNLIITELEEPWDLASAPSRALVGLHRNALDAMNTQRFGFSLPKRNPGEYELADKERLALQLCASGLKISAINEHVPSANTQLSSAYRKLRASNGPEAVTKCIVLKEVDYHKVEGTHPLRRPLTKGEVRFMRYMTQGLDYKAIGDAQEPRVSKSTVTEAMGCAYLKLGSRSRAQAVSLMFRLGLFVALPYPPPPKSAKGYPV